MHSRLLLGSCLIVLSVLLHHWPTNAQHVDIQFKRNLTTLVEVLHDAEKFILKFNETYNFPSLTFGLAHKGRPILKKAWGFADLENYVPAKVTTRYRIASISKTFTSTLVGTLVDKGLVHYDDPVSKFVSESIFPAKKWNGKTVNITIRQLLSHTAGLHVSDPEVDFNQVQVVSNVTQMLHQFSEEPLHFAPGSNFNYSNYGFQLLGAVVESVTKRPFPLVMTDFLQAHGLNSTYVGSSYTILHDSARYYAPKDPKQNLKENIPAIPLDDVLMLQGYWPAGGILSNVDDLLHYGQLLVDSYKSRKNAILSQRTLKQIWSPEYHKIPFPFYFNSDYGLGWLIGSDNPKVTFQHVFWHAGGLPGVSTMLIVYPEEEIVGVALVNKGGLTEMDQMIAYTVENAYHLLKQLSECLIKLNCNDTMH